MEGANPVKTPDVETDLEPLVAGPDQECDDMDREGDSVTANLVRQAQREVGAPLVEYQE